MSKQNIRRWGKHPVAFGIAAGVFAGSAYLIFNNSPDEERVNIPVNITEAADTHSFPAPGADNQQARADVDFHFDDADEGDDELFDSRESPVAEAAPAPAPQMAAKADEPRKAAPTKADAELAAVENEFETTLTEMTDDRTVLVPHPEHNRDAAPAETATAKVAQAEAAPAPAPVKAAPAPAKKAAAPAVSSGGKYTLQLLGAGNEKSVKQFISRHGIAANSKYFRTTRAGKEWFVLVYGEFPSQQEAKAAISQMPASIRQENLRPWVREMSVVKKEVGQG